MFKEAFCLLKLGSVLLDADLIANDSSQTGTITMEEHAQILKNVGFEDLVIERRSKHLVTYEQKGVYSGLIRARKLIS